MTKAPNHSTQYLLPAPRDTRALSGVARITSALELDIACPDPRIERAALRWRSSLDQTGLQQDESLRDGSNAATMPSTRALRLRVANGAAPHRDGYTLTIAPEAIELCGASVVGCFHGLQTLAQLTHAHNALVPCSAIRDWPDFPTRGLLLDVSRGRVPTLDTLKRLVDRLALLKINQLQLYIEHAFVFSFDKEICASDDGLTPDEVRKLGEYCRERFIDLVPAMATLGHMGRILSMPRYCHLAEIEAPKPWAEMTWPQRNRGLTLDCHNPESVRLMERMWTDVMDAFDGRIVNVCGDEPWDFGKGRNRERLSETGVGEAYVQHVCRVHDVCALRGRQTQAWSDVLRNHPDLLSRLPKNLTILHWGYDDDAAYDATRQLVDAGLETFVCPGTSGWKRVLNAMSLAERNISTFAERGHACGAKGLINTDWGDHGHFNMPACSLHAIALGAAFGWQANHPSDADFDTRFARTILGLEDSTAISLLRRASHIANSCETWRLLWMPLRAARDDATLPSKESAEDARKAVEQVRDLLDRLKPADAEIRRDVAELSLASRFTQLVIDKVEMARLGIDAPPTSPQAVAWSQELQTSAEAYGKHWTARNKPSGLDDILRALKNAADEVRSAGA